MHIACQLVSVLSFRDYDENQRQIRLEQELHVPNSPNIFFCRKAS